MNKQQVFHNLETAAKAGASIEEIARQLGFSDKADFEKFLQKNKDAKEIWDQARFELWAETKKAVISNAKQGNQAAINLVSELLRDERGISSSTLTPAQLVELTGKTHQTIAAWRNKEGLPYDKRTRTYNLRDVIQFLEKYYISIGRKRKPAKSSTNKFQDVKTKKLQMELEKERGNLLDRKEVLAGIIARYQRLIQYSNRLTDLATQVEGKPFKQIIEALIQFFTKLIEAQKDDFTELKLPTEAKSLFIKLLRLLSKSKT